MEEYYFFDNRPHQATIQNQFTAQTQCQSIIIRKSNLIDVCQFEAQALIILQLSLKAALDAVLVVFDAQEDTDVLALQKIIQELDVIQHERQRVVIECSDNVTIKQKELQVDVLVQKSIELLATITAKFIEV